MMAAVVFVITLALFCALYMHGVRRADNAREPPPELHIK
jgi:hypothetical protein